MSEEQIKNLIGELIEKITVKTNRITITRDSGDNTWFSVEVSEPRFFLGQNGEALQALNHIVRKIIETKTQFPDADTRRDFRTNILIDINDFQKRKVENIYAIAHMMSERAKYFKSNIEIDPMPSFERKIIHEFLSKSKDLKTESIGFGSARRVVIKYIGSL